jgi:hypothetical protein
MRVCILRFAQVSEKKGAILMNAMNAMNAKYGLSTLIVVLSMVLMLSAPAVRADGPALQLPGGVTVSQTYVDVLSYWYKQTFPQEWATRLAEALQPAPSSSSTASPTVVLTGVPASAWWIDAWRLELSGSWTNAGSGWSFSNVAEQAPGPVQGDLMTQGNLPGVYIIRACDKTGNVLVGGPKLLVVFPTKGVVQTFSLPTLVTPPPDQLAQVKM